MYFLGVDLGSSSVKLALIDSRTGQRKALVNFPEEEMAISAPQKGWAEQSPELWWSYVCQGIALLLQKAEVPSELVTGIGLGYQMHGLVVVDADGAVLRDSIIWCDSRAIQQGEEMAVGLGEDYCRNQLLNEPGNFTASKLAWVKEHEPELFSKIYKFMLPGDFLAYKLTGQFSTTATGLSEGILWDFPSNRIAKDVLQEIGASSDLVPELVPILGNQGTLDAKGAKETGLQEGTPLLYRAGDQPNNALALQVLEAGEVAATGGTSGVIYAVSDSTFVKESTRINNFVHVSHTKEKLSIGKLLCINGCGILYRWVLNNFQVASYEEMNALASSVPIGSEELMVIPFGNGAERMLLNTEVGGHIVGLDFNRHTKAHICRAALEGIAFSFYYGFEILQGDGVSTSVIRTGNDNLFRSELFATTVATLLGLEIEIYNTTGAEGAARACALAQGKKTLDAICKMTTS
jgi:xylulokinase